MILCCLAALIVLGPLRDAFDGTPVVRFAGAVALFLAPGVLLAHWLLRGRFPGAALVPTGTALSASVFGAAGFPMLFLHLDLDTYLRAAGAVVAVFLLAATLAVLLGGATEEDEGVSPEPSSEWLWVPFVALGGIVAYVAQIKTPIVDGDTWNYLAWVREFLNTDELALYNPYFGNEIEGVSRAQINGWFLEQAALSQISGIDPVPMVLYYLAPTLAVVSLLAFYALARVLFESESAALLCGSLYALFLLVHLGLSVQSTFGGEFVGRVVQDKYFTRFVFMPVILALAAAFLKDRRRRYLGVFAFLCVAVIFVHPVGLAVCGLAVSGFGLFFLIFNFRERSAWTGVASLASVFGGILLVPAMYVLLRGVSPADALYPTDIGDTQPEVLANQVFVRPEWEKIFTLGENFYIMHPNLILNPVIAAAFLIGVPLLARKVKVSLAAQLLLGVLSTSTVVSYFPPVSTFIGEWIIAPGQLHRLSWPLSLAALLIAGWMAWRTSAFAAAKLRLPPRFAVLSPLLMVVILASATAPLWLSNIEDARESEAPPLSSSFFDPIFPWLRENIGEPGVLLAPDKENTAIPAYSPNLDVVSFRGAPVLDNLEELEEITGTEIETDQGSLDVRSFFSNPALTLEERASILRRNEVDYVMAFSGTPLDDYLELLPGFTRVETPSERYALFEVDIEELYSSGSEPSP